MSRGRPEKKRTSVLSCYFWPLLGLIGLFFWWWLAVRLLRASVPMAAYFAPEEAWHSAVRLLSRGILVRHALDSLRRVLVGLSLALAFGLPLGLLVGGIRAFDRATGLVFQLLRMVSPLSWMPLAVMFLGIGDAPVYFLLALAGVWPIILNTAAGVAAIDPKWLNLAKSLSANRREVYRYIILPGILDHLLTGLRLAIGVIWIVLVPAEMLGVQAGLGYFILDARDRMEYGDLVVAILVIGLLGATLDGAARRLRLKWLPG
ncbi:MAG: ABC transporter permease [Deltaproteobacteria bacterium]|nr:ABC transporter permease [Deltaproteobacteria bacterium]